VAQHPREHHDILALEVVAEQGQRDQAAAVHCIDLLGVPEVAAPARVHAQGGVPVQRIQVVLLSLHGDGRYRSLMLVSLRRKSHQNIMFHLQDAGYVDQGGVGESALLDGQHLQLQLSDEVRQHAKTRVALDVTVLKSQPADR
jgi:hypothetical protein